MSCGCGGACDTAAAAPAAAGAFYTPTTTAASNGAGGWGITTTTTITAPGAPAASRAPGFFASIGWKDIAIGLALSLLFTRKG